MLQDVLRGLTWGLQHILLLRLLSNDVWLIIFSNKFLAVVEMDKRLFILHLLAVSYQA